MNTREEYPIGTMVCGVGVVSQWFRIGKVVGYREDPAALIIEIPWRSLRRGHSFIQKYIVYPVCPWNTVIEIPES